MVIQVSPIHTYFVAHLPKLLLSSTFLAAVGFLADSRLNALAFHALGFVACLSFLGHKEWRFIIYVVPVLNVAAARGARALSVAIGFLQNFLLYRFRCRISWPKGTLFGRLSFAAFAIMLLANSVCTLVYTYGSMENYPGGASLARFDEYCKSVDNGIPSHSSTQSRFLRLLQCMCIYPTWQHKQALVYSFRHTPLHTTLPSLPRVQG